MSSDLTFLTNEPGKSLLDRFHALLGTHTQFFDCLVGYFMISGFYKLYPALEHTEKVRIERHVAIIHSQFRIANEAGLRVERCGSDSRATPIKLGDADCDIKWCIRLECYQ